MLVYLYLSLTPMVCLIHTHRIKSETQQPRLLLKKIPVNLPRITSTNEYAPILDLMNWEIQLLVVVAN